MPHVLFRYKNQHRNIDKKAVNNVEDNFQLDIHTDRLIPVHARKLLNMVNICFIAEGQYHMITLALYISIFLCFCGFESGENYISDAVSFLCHHLIAIINAQVCDKINVVIACYLMAPPPPPLSSELPGLPCKTRTEISNNLYEPMTTKKELFCLNIASMH